MNEALSLQVLFDGGRDYFSPGEELAGTARWQLPRAPSSLEVRLFWSTAGRGDRDFEVVASEVVDRPAPAGEHRFRFQLPLGPYSFSGQLVSLLWAVELVLPDEEVAGHAELVLGPGGCEARIDGGEPADGDEAAEATPGRPGPQGAAPA